MRARRIVNTAAVLRFAVTPGHGWSMSSLLKFDQTTLANMTAALEYIYLKLPPDRDSPAIRKQVAQVLVSTADSGQVSLSELKNAGLDVVNTDLFPPSRSWLKVLER